METKHEHAIGDLVICKYELDYYIRLSPFLSKMAPVFYVGIIVARESHLVVFFNRDLVYEVLCTDGQRRFFAKWEVEKLSL